MDPTRRRKERRERRGEGIRGKTEEERLCE